MSSADPRPARNVVIRGHLGRILTAPAPANLRDRLDPDYVRGVGAENWQLEQILILQMVYSPDAVARVYMRWVDDSVRAQRKTAVPLASWDEVAVSSSPIGWERDNHGFLCHVCGECTWQLCSMTDDIERLCGRCARRELRCAPGEV